MTTTTVPPGYRINGLDGKVYPGHALPREDLRYLIGRCHYLHHAEGLSVRQIVARLQEDHGVRRSVGSVSEYLSRNRCEDCSGEENPHLNSRPEHAVWQPEPECSGDQNRPPEQFDYSERVEQLITEHRQMRGRRPSTHMLAVAISSVATEAEFWVSDSFAALDDGSIDADLAGEFIAVAEHLVEVAKYLQGRGTRRSE